MGFAHYTLHNSQQYPGCTLHIAQFTTVPWMHIAHCTIHNSTLDAHYTYHNSQQYPGCTLHIAQFTTVYPGFTLHIAQFTTVPWMHITHCTIYNSTLMHIKRCTIYNSTLMHIKRCTIHNSTLMHIKRCTIHNSTLDSHYTLHNLQQYPGCTLHIAQFTTAPYAH